MTFQTTPNLPWIFPDQAYHMNHRGTIPELEMHPIEAVVGAESPWAKHEQQVAMDRVRNTQRAKEGMEGHLNTTERSQRYERPASRSAVHNGVFEGSPMYYSTSGNAFRGGRIYTKEGQEWLAKRLKERAGEYSAPAGTFKDTPMIALSPYADLDLILSQLFVSFASGSFTASTADQANKLLQALLRNGAKFEPNQIGNYAQNVGRLIETIRPSVGEEHGQIRGFTFEATEERLRLVDQIYKTLQLCDQVVREIARTIYDTQSGREQIMSTLTSRLLGSQAATFDPTVVSPASRQAVQNVRPPQLGRTFEGQPPREVERGFPLPGPRDIVPFGAEFNEPEPDLIYFPQQQQQQQQPQPDPFAEQQPNPNQDLEDLVGRMEGLGKKRGRPRKYKR
jgi:hypothetical protein